MASSADIWLFVVLSLQFYISFSFGRIHNLHLKDETRSKIQMSTFGLQKGGVYSVDIHNLTVTPIKNDANGKFEGFIVFSLDKSTSAGTSPYLEKIEDGCKLNDQKNDPMSNIIFNITTQSSVNITQIGKELRNLSIGLYQNGSKLNASLVPVNTNNGTRFYNLTNIDEKSAIYSIINITFNFSITTTQEEGLYNLYFHLCSLKSSASSAYKMETKMIITEYNKDRNYLSAGEIPLPTIYFVMSSLFFLSSCFWLYILRRNKEEVFKIHYLMLLVGYIKALSLLFHAVDYLFIAQYGNPIQSWAVMYYITHLLKGALLFMTIALIGTGWAFVKHILSDRDKKIFMIVIPLQILANVAYIIIESTEESQLEYTNWRTVFFLVDLLCCGAILFPVVWSIRHLQDASTTDGKAASSLGKLKLFRHFYILIVCYIYFTRIIFILLKSTVPFQYEWLSAFFTELATYAFYVLTAYKFRPTPNNPYLIISQEDEEEIEMDEVLTENGVTNGVKRVNQNHASTETTVPIPRDLSNHT